MLTTSGVDAMAEREAIGGQQPTVGSIALLVLLDGHRFVSCDCRGPRRGQGLGPRDPVVSTAATNGTAVARRWALGGVASCHPSVRRCRRATTRAGLNEINDS